MKWIKQSESVLVWYQFDSTEASKTGNLVLDRDVNAARNILNKALCLDEAVVA